MFGTDYLLGCNQGRSSAELDRDTNAIVARVIYGQRPVTVDQSYIDRLHAALEAARANSTHWRQKTDQFRNEALYWRDEKYAPVRVKAKARREEIAVLQAENATLRDDVAV